MKLPLHLLFLGLLTTISVRGQAPTPQLVRQSIAQAVHELNVQPVTVGSVDNKRIGSGADSIPIRIYRPDNAGSAAALPIIYHIHGGAWVGGDLDTHDNICRRLCHDARAVVVAVDYRRPPEHLYPASTDDAMAVLTWIQANRATLSQRGPLILLGDSAGGNFVASTCLRNAVSAKPVPIATQVLINPALDIRPGSVTYKTYGMFIDWGLPDLSKANEPYASPLLSNQLSRMPPTVIVVGEIDEIQEDGLALHRKLEASGVKSSLFVQKQAGHFGPYWSADHSSVKPALTFVLQQIAAVK